MDEDDTQQPAGNGRRRLDLGAKTAAPAPEQAPPPAAPAPEQSPPPAAKTEPEQETVDNSEPVNVFAPPAPTHAVLLKAPANSAPFMLDGEEFTPDADGLVEVPGRHAHGLRAHGFEAV